MKFFISILSLLKALSLVLSKSQQINNNNDIFTNIKNDEIYSIMSWARKNNIYIDDSLELIKNELNDIKHNFYYFKSNNTIPNNTLLMKVPSNIMISQPLIDEFLKKSKNKKFMNLWEKVSLINKYINYSSAKQLFYISIILSDSIFKQKGKFYKKYKEYLNMYDYINLDNFPLFYSAKEMIYLNNSHFGKEINNNLKSINNEYYLIKNILNLDDTVLVDEFIKYRILSLSNSIYYNNITYIIPFIDCFQKKVNRTNGKSNAYIKINLHKNNSFDLEIYSNKKIEKNKEIKLLWKQISNIECLLYYGFIDENNLITSKYLVELVNKNFIKDLPIDEVNKKYRINFDKLIEPKVYDINNEFFHNFIYYAYSNLSKYFDQYYHYNEGPYQMMKDNLNYYLAMYNEIYNNDMINMNINGFIKKKQVKNILELEQKLIESRLKLLNSRIDRYRKNKKEEDIYELLRRSANHRKNGFLETINNDF